MTKQNIVEFVKEHYPGDERMLEWAIAMDNQPKDWSNFLMAIVWLLIPVLFLVLKLRSEGKLPIKL